MSGAFLAVDWGTTNRRLYQVEDGRVSATMRDERGITAVPADGFAREAAAMRAAYGDLPMLIAGMAGSNRGWADAGYVACPATPADLAAALVEVGPGVRIVPGVKRVGAEGGTPRADVMRGEEMQLLGAVAAKMVPSDALLCQPGTHAKWARLAGGALADFTTAMTGELFALLRTHALIGAAMTAGGTGEIDDGPAFRAGVCDAADDDLLARLFGVRPASLLALRPDADAGAYVSGLLIGADCRARLRGGEGHVYLLADGALARLYAAAIKAQGAVCTTVDSHAAFVAGITQIWELAR